MVNLATLHELLETYRKYGWALRRVLLSPESYSAFADDPIFDDVLVTKARVDAVWFSRPPKTGTAVAWELRYLGEPPFALVESLDESVAEFEESLGAAENRLTDSIAAK